MSQASGLGAGSLTPFHQAPPPQIPQPPQARIGIQYTYFKALNILAWFSCFWSECEGGANDEIIEGCEESPKGVRIRVCCPAPKAKPNDPERRVSLEVMIRSL